MKENLEHLRKLYSDCELSPSDIYKEKKHNTETSKEESYVLITRTGIEKIIDKKNIRYNLSIEDSGLSHCTVKVHCWFSDEINSQVMTLGSASVDNCKFKRYPEMAEKRAIARGVLKLTKAYSLGLKSIDEMDDKNLISVSTKPTKKKNPVSGAELKLKNRKSI
jgi:hypothetical protein